MVSTLFNTSLLDAEELHIRHVVGGQTTALEIRGDYWYQSLGDRLLVLRKQGGTQVATIMLAQKPAAAFCNDLLVDGDTLYAVLEGQEVVVLDLANPRAPKIIQRKNRTALGISPQHLSRVGSWPVVIGHGGAVRLTDGTQLIQCDEEITGIVLSIDKGLVYASNRRMFDADTNEFLGSATRLMELGEEANADIGTLVYTRNMDGETEVGLMTSSMRDVDIHRGKVTLQGDNSNITIRGSRIIVSTNKGVYVLGIAPKELRLLRSFDVHGVKDVGVVASNYLAMCGSFGRGVYRIESDSGGNGETLFRVVNSISSMFAGRFDRKGVIVPTETGSIYYGFDGRVEISDSTVESVEVPVRAVVLGSEVLINPQSGEATMINSIGEVNLDVPYRVFTVVPISGNFWLGAENGVYVVEIDADGLITETNHIELAGPIVQLIPLFDGSAAFVSASGFVGIIEQVQVAVALEQ